ncbi:MAG TPA: hypothetical protein VJS44_08640 [Pyrinomonadaceae bacterium]|nr:hypothetical protein [Pyrinomonadaceae bacterium]
MGRHSGSLLEENGGKTTTGAALMEWRMLENWAKGARWDFQTKLSSGGLYVMTQCIGKVLHEPKLKGTNPDIYFTSLDEPKQSFIADIATLSDKGLNQSYPVEDFHNRLMEIARQRGLRGNSFYLHIDSDYSKVFRGGGKPILKLPTQPKFNEAIFNENFEAFLNAIRDAPNERRQFVIRDEAIGIVIVYNPAQPFAITSHLSYSIITSLIQNTIYNRLSEKAYKLVNADCSHPLGLIVCNGGYSLFNHSRNWDSYGFSEVIRYLLQEYPAISFILTITIEQHFGFNSYSEVKMQLYEGASFNSIGENLLNSISKLNEVLPIPERDAKNAVYLLKASGKTQKGSSFWGGLEMSSEEVTISARVILELLAGKITQEDFFKVYRFVPVDSETHYYGNPFAVKLEDGRLIKEVKFKKGENEEDDDWLVFRFGDADPAISPFTVPEVKDLT